MKTIMLSTIFFVMVGFSGNSLFAMESQKNYHSDWEIKREDHGSTYTMVFSPANETPSYIRLLSLKKYDDRSLLTLMVKPTNIYKYSDKERLIISKLPNLRSFNGIFVAKTQTDNLTILEALYEGGSAPNSIFDVIVKELNINDFRQRYNKPNYQELIPLASEGAQKVGILKTMFECFYYESPITFLPWLEDVSYAETEEYAIFKVKFLPPISLCRQPEAIHFAIVSKDKKYFLMTSLTAGYYAPLGKNDECVYKPKEKFEWFGSSSEPLQRHTSISDEEYYKIRAKISNDAMLPQKAPFEGVFPVPNNYQESLKNIDFKKAPFMSIDKRKKWAEKEYSRTKKIIIYINPESCLCTQIERLAKAEKIDFDFMFFSLATRFKLECFYCVPEFSIDFYFDGQRDFPEIEYLVKTIVNNAINNHLSLPIKIDLKNWPMNALLKNYLNRIDIERSQRIEFINVEEVADDPSLHI